MSNNVFDENAGRLLGPSETKPMKEAYHQSKLASGHKENEITRSEFFGLTHVNRLLKQPGCVGIRVHYAKRWEDDNGMPMEQGKGKFNSRILLTGVDARGRDLPVQTGSGGLKDSDSDGEMVVGDGFPCPQHCGDKN